MQIKSSCLQLLVKFIIHHHIIVTAAAPSLLPNIYYTTKKIKLTHSNKNEMIYKQSSSSQNWQTTFPAAIFISQLQQSWRGGVVISMRGGKAVKVLRRGALGNHSFFFGGGISSSPGIKILSVEVKIRSSITSTRKGTNEPPL